MILEILVAILLGVASGIFTGLTPGLHINLVAVGIVAFSAVLFSYFSPLAVVVLIIAMSVTHTFLDCIPSIYLGAPDPAMALTALPGHQMLLEGKGHVAVLYTLIGSFAGLLLSILFVPVFIFATRFLYPFVREGIGFILIAIVLFLLVREMNRWVALLYFLSSGLLGVLVFQAPMSQPLLPLLSGLFGVSLLLISIFQDSIVPKQKLGLATIQVKNVFASIISVIVGFFAAFLPGFGASQAAIIATTVLRRASKELFLVLVGGINTVSMVLSLVTFYVIEKARNGSIVAVSELVSQLSLPWLIVIFVSCIIVGSIAMLLGLRISRIFSFLLEKVSYKFVVLVIVLLLSGMVWYFDSLLGFSVLLISTCIGISAQLVGIPKHYLLGCLLFSVIIYFL